MRLLSKEIDAMANDFTNVDYREKIKKLTLFDAILFRKAFDLNIVILSTASGAILELL